MLHWLAYNSQYVESMVDYPWLYDFHHHQHHRCYIISAFMCHFPELDITGHITHLFSHLIIHLCLWALLEMFLRDCCVLFCHLCRWRASHSVSFLVPSIFGHCIMQFPLNWCNGSAISLLLLFHTQCLWMLYCVGKSICAQLLWNTVVDLHSDVNIMKN